MTEKKIIHEIKIFELIGINYLGELIIARNNVDQKTFVNMYLKKKVSKTTTDKLFLGLPWWHSG